MVRFHFSARIPLPADVYFVERDTERFRALQAKILKLGELHLAEEWREGNKHVLRIATMPNVGKYIPKAIKKTFQLEDISFEDVLEYTEEKAAGPEYVLNFKSIPPFAPDKIDISGLLRITPLDEHSCIHSIEASADIKIFGVGNIVESIIIDSVGRSYKQLPRVALEWARSRNKILQEAGLEGLLDGRPSMDILPGEAMRKAVCEAYRSPFANSKDPDWTQRRGRRSNRSLVVEDSAESVPELDDSCPETEVHGSRLPALSNRSVDTVSSRKCAARHDSDDMLGRESEMYVEESSVSSGTVYYDLLDTDDFQDKDVMSDASSEVTMYSAVSSIHSAKHGRRTRRRARPRWCWGTQFHSRADDAFSVDESSDEIIRKGVDTPVLGEISISGIQDRNVIEEDRGGGVDDSETRSPKWLLCGAPHRRKDAGTVNKGNSGQETFDAKQQKRKHRRRKHRRSSSRKTADCGWWVMCKAPAGRA